MTDGRTDRILLAIPRLRYMQRGKNCPKGGVELPVICRKWLKTQTSNFARELTVRNTKPQNEQLGKLVRGLGHVTYFSNFVTP